MAPVRSCGDVVGDSAGKIVASSCPPLGAAFALALDAGGRAEHGSFGTKRMMTEVGVVQPTRMSATTAVRFASMACGSAGRASSLPAFVDERRSRREQRISADSAKGTRTVERHGHILYSCAQHQSSLVDWWIVQPATAKPCILVVEDSLLNQMILEQRLRPAFEMKFAGRVSSGIALVDLCAEAGRSPSVVLSDYALADGDGFAVLAHAQLRFPNVPRVLMSSSTPTELDQRIGFGIVARFVKKPVRLQDLLSLSVHSLATT